MSFGETLVTSSVPAVAAIATLWLNNRHTIRVQREERVAEMAASKESARLAIVSAERERARKLIAEALGDLGRVRGELSAAMIEATGGVVPSEPVAKASMGALATSLYLACAEYPQGWLWFGARDVLEAVRSSSEHLASVDSDGVGSASRSLLTIDHLAQQLVEVAAGKSIDLTAHLPTP